MGTTFGGGSPMSFGVAGSGNRVLGESDYECMKGPSVARRPDESGQGFDYSGKLRRGSCSLSNNLNSFGMRRPFTCQPNDPVDSRMVR